MSSPRRRLLLTLAATAALAACASPPAHAGRLVDVQLVDRSSTGVMPSFDERGTAWVAGRPGDRFAVRLTNHTPARVLVVLSVDGVNAITGQTAAASQSGYVLAPWQSADITGWRKSDAEAAAFYFTALPDSYAARTDRPQNVGVIGAAVFRERVQRPIPIPFVPMPPTSRGRAESPERLADARRQAADANDTGNGTRDAAPSSAESGARAGALTGSAGTAQAAAKAAAPLAAQATPAPALEPDALRSARPLRLGTGHGEREYAPITHTAFERASVNPAEIVELRYDSWENLVAAGIIQTRIAQPRAFPQPFPGYVPDPR